MKRKGKLLITALCLLCIAAFGMFAGCDLDYSAYNALYDDDAYIAQDIGGKSLRVNAVHSSTPHSYSGSAAKFSGVDTVVNGFTVNGDTALEVKKFELEEGDFKLVLTDGEHVYKLFENEGSGTVDLSGVPFGSYRIKIVGREAKYALELAY